MFTYMSVVPSRKKKPCALHSEHAPVLPNSSSDVDDPLRTFSVESFTVYSCSILTLHIVRHLLLHNCLTRPVKE
jgi:hypothetical protein